MCIAKLSHFRLVKVRKRASKCFVALLRTTSDGDSDNDIKQNLTSVPIGLLVKHQHGILDLQIVKWKEGGLLDMLDENIKVIYIFFLIYNMLPVNTFFCI